MNIITVDVVGSWCWKMQLITDPLLKDAPQGISIEFPKFQLNITHYINITRAKKISNRQKTIV